MYYTPETWLNHVFEDLWKTKAPKSHVSVSMVKVLSTPHLLQASNLQPMLVGIVETLVTTRIIVLS
jgi:hypothetical protein